MLQDRILKAAQNIVKTESSIRRNTQNATEPFYIITLQLPSSYEEIKGTIYSDYGFKYTQEANWSRAGSEQKLFRLR